VQRSSSSRERRRVAEQLSGRAEHGEVVVIDDDVSGVLAVAGRDVHVVG
jgi:hypothetical protein